MRHPLDRSVGSDLSYFVSQKLRKPGEPDTSAFHLRDQRFDAPAVLVAARRRVSDTDDLISHDAEPDAVLRAVSEQR